MEFTEASEEALADWWDRSGTPDALEAIHAAMQAVEDERWDRLHYERVAVVDGSGRVVRTRQRGLVLLVVFIVDFNHRQRADLRQIIQLDDNHPDLESWGPG